MEFGRPNCGVCKRRPRDDGGNGSCPHAGTATFTKLSRLDSHDCAAFKLGDNPTLHVAEAKARLRDHPGLF